MQSRGITKSIEWWEWMALESQTKLLAWLDDGILYFSFKISKVLISRSNFGQFLFHFNYRFMGQEILGFCWLKILHA